MNDKIKALENLLTNYEQKKLSRRELIASILATTAAATVTHGASAQQVAPAAVGRSLNHISVSVSDVNRSAEFYQRVLGLEIISRPANGGLNMGLGPESFLGLYQLSNPGTMSHLCIGVDNYDADRLAARLSEHDIEARVNRNPANRTSGGDQLYFNDPDGISVQLAQHGYLG